MLANGINIFPKAISVRTAKQPAIFIHFPLFCCEIHKNTNEKSKTVTSPQTVVPFTFPLSPAPFRRSAKSVESHKVASICTAAELKPKLKCASNNRNRSGHTQTDAHTHTLLYTIECVWLEKFCRAFWLTSKDLRTRVENGESPNIVGQRVGQRAGYWTNIGGPTELEDTNWIWIRTQLGFAFWHSACKVLPERHKFVHFMTGFIFEALLFSRVDARAVGRGRI